MEHADVVKAVIEAEERARLSVNSTPNVQHDSTQKIEKEVVNKSEDKTTKVIGPYTSTKMGDTKLVSTDKKGEMNEMVLISPSTEFRIEMIVDGNILYNTDYSRFQSIASRSQNLAAFQNDDGEYVLHISDIEWSDSFKLSVKSKNIIFSNVYVKYKEVV